MDKEKVLDLASKKNSGKDIVDLEVSKYGGSIGMAVGAVIAFALNLVEVILFNSFNLGYLLIWSSMGIALFLYKFIKLKKKHELIVFIGYLLLTIGLVAGYAIGLGNIL